MNRLEGGGEETFVGKHTDTIRQFGRKEYRWLEGVSVLDNIPVGEVFALRSENGVLYGFQMTSTQMPEAMADFEQILSDAEYSGQYDPSWVEGDTGIAPGVVVLGVGAAVAVLCGAAILFRRRRGEKSE